MTHDELNLAVDILEQALDISVATNRADGWPQATIVSYVHDGLVIYFGTWARSQKAANVARDPRVSVTACAPYKSWSQIRALSIAGEAAVVTDAAELARVGQMMMRRFGEELSRQVGVNLSETCFVRITPKFVSILDYSKGFGHKVDRAVAAGEALGGGG